MSSALTIKSKTIQNEVTVPCYDLASYFLGKWAESNKLLCRDGRDYTQDQETY